MEKPLCQCLGLTPLAQPPSDDPHDVTCQLRFLLDQGGESLHVNGRHPTTGAGDRRGASWLIVQQCEFAKTVPFTTRLHHGK